MKNEEKFKTPEERQKAFEAYCNEQKYCQSCPIDKMTEYGYCSCEFIWQSLEYQEPKQDLPFEIRRKGCYVSIYAKDGDIDINASRIEDCVDDICELLNTAALKWHEHINEKEDKEC